MRGSPEAIPAAGGTVGALDLPLDSQERERLARAYAPVVWIHSAERYGPSSPDDFLRSSALYWRRLGPDKRVAAQGRVEPGRLGARCDEAPGGCYEHDGYVATQLTRPHDGKRQRPKALPKSRGFYLDVPDSARRGQVGAKLDAPVLYEIRVGRTVRITYWFFFGFSSPFKPFLGVNLASVVSHEGDWENIDVTVRLDGRPSAVYYYGHGHPRATNWQQVCKIVGRVEDCTSSRAGHPVVYSARSSHASYPRASEARDDSTRVCKRILGRAICSYDFRNRGFRWNPAAQADGLRDVRAETWYGFGGAWGKAGRLADTTGPLGPSAFKLSDDLEPGELVSSPEGPPER